LTAPVFTPRLARLPGRLAACWNWKAALLSSSFRAAIFLVANLRHGWDAALGAMLAEFAYRSVAAGFYGRATQALRRIEPAWRGSLAAAVGMPAVGHLLEFLLHKTRGTPGLRTSITASVIFTIWSSLFHLYAMRRGHFIVGEGSRSLREDLRRVPQLLAGFLAAPFRTKNCGSVSSKDYDPAINL
jgi:hypothetical protein